MKIPPSFSWRSGLAAALLAVLCASADAMFAGPKLTPVDRLLKSAEAFLAKHPANADAHYTLARIHYLAFHMKEASVPAFHYEESDENPPQMAPQWMLGWGRPEKDAAKKLLSDKAVAAHAVKAMDEFHEALRLNPKDGLAQLGIASLLEEFAEWNRTAKVTEIPPELGKITPAQVRAAYAKALSLAMEKDSKLTTMPLPGINSITSHEAASALIRLAKDKAAELTESERKDVADAERAVRQFKALRMGAITPMVFSFQPTPHLDGLLAPETVVDFDLRGYGPRERWPWVKPQLGFLVWDPERKADIRSAHQLFGGYTFQIPRANGYDALAALDDNADGALTGSELDGISVWFDRNGDGISSPDEVTPLRDLAIVSIAVTMDGHDGIHPTNARGITLRDGRTLRTWDWIAEPVREASAQLARATAGK